MMRVWKLSLRGIKLVERGLNSKNSMANKAQIKPMPVSYTHLIEAVIVSTSSLTVSESLQLPINRQRTNIRMVFFISMVVIK